MELLIVAGVGSVVMAGTLKTLTISTQSAAVVRSSLSEQELRLSVSRALTEDQCKANFKPTASSTADHSGLKGTDREKGVGDVTILREFATDSTGLVTTPLTSPTGAVTLLKTGTAFKNDLDIVKMSIEGDITPFTDAKNPKKQAVTRTFSVYYKKKNLGDLNTLGGNVCTATDTTGCYFNHCSMKYGLQDQANPGVTTCQVMDCVGIAGGGGNVACYKVEQTGAQKTLVGCGGTQNITGAQTVAIGYGAGGSSTTGTKNTFLGWQAGNKTTTGANNTFLGYQAGVNHTTGHQNTFVGKGAGYSNTSGSYNLFVGYNTGYKTTTGANNTFLGWQAGYENTTGGRILF